METNCRAVFITIYGIVIVSDQAEVHFFLSLHRNMLHSLALHEDRYSVDLNLNDLPFGLELIPFCLFRILGTPLVSIKSCRPNRTHWQTEIELTVFHSNGSLEWIISVVCSRRRGNGANLGYTIPYFRLLQQKILPNRCSVIHDQNHAIFTRLFPCSVLLHRFRGAFL